MPRLLDVLLDEDTIVAEARFGFRAAGLEALASLLVIARHAQTLATATRRSLDHHRVPDITRDPDGVGRAGDHVSEARYRADVGLRRQLLRRDLVAHRSDRGRLGSDEHDAGGLDISRKCFVLRQEAVAGMNRLRTRGATGLDDEIAAQVGFTGRGGPQVNRLVGELHMTSITVRIGKHRHGDDTHPPRSGDHAACNFTAIGNQNFLEHGWRGHFTAEYCRACATGSRDPCRAAWQDCGTRACAFRAA